MGCEETKDQLPTLLCFYETENNEQKNYCLKLKENYRGSKNIRYEIKQIPQIPFGIKLRINEKVIDIQKVFNDSDEAMNQTLNKIYELLDNNGNEKEKEEKENEKGPTIE